MDSLIHTYSHGSHHNSRHERSHKYSHHGSYHGRSHNNHSRRGCDPLRSCVRSQLQVKRMEVNDQLNKQLMLKQGCENLARAAQMNNIQKTRDIAIVELSFVNSSLQLLRDELQEINGTIIPFQSHALAKSIPMIPLGLKESKSVDFTASFRDFILEHYSEQGKKFDKEITELNNLREASRTPTRTEDGVDLLLEYYNQLYYVDNRFFPPNRHLNIFITWYDTLTGHPSVQRTMAFERGAILFNIGSLYTQMGSKTDRSRRDGIEESIEFFQKAAGYYNYIRLNFSNAPGLDMSPSFLNMLVNLMIAQAQECRFEKHMLGGLEAKFKKYINVGHEAAKVSEKFSLVYKVMTMDAIKEHIPYSWSVMVEIKSIHYKALSHYYVSLALIENPGSAESSEVCETLRNLYIVESVQGWSAGLAVATVDVQQLQQEQERGIKSSGLENYQIPQRPEEMGKRRKTRKLMGKAHLRQAIYHHEQALRIHMLCKLLRKLDLMHGFLTHAHERAMAKLSRIQEREAVDDQGDLPDAPEIAPRVYDEAETVPPNFGRIKVVDIFKKLGPLSIFCARNHFSAPRTVKMILGNKSRKSKDQREKTGAGHAGFGFTVRGDAPVIVANVEPDSKAHGKGIKEGDVIVKVNGRDMKYAKHTDVVDSLQRADAQNANVSIDLVTVQGVETAVYHRPQPNRMQQNRSRMHGGPPRGYEHRVPASGGGGGFLSVFKGRQGHGVHSQVGGRRRSRSIYE